MLGRRHITDVTATLLYSLGLAVPSDFEGSVPAGMFTDAWKATHPILIGAPTLSGQGKQQTETMDEEEKQKIMEQLQMLGYME